MLVIEQAREAKDVTLRATLLERAIGILDKVEPAADRPEEECGIPEVNEGIDPVYLERGVIKERTSLWADICLIAWHSQLSRLTRQAAEVAVVQEWDVEKDRDMIVQQAQVHFANAEAVYMDLRKQNAEPGKVLRTGTPGSKAAASAAGTKTRHHCHLLLSWLCALCLCRRAKQLPFRGLGFKV
jgi:hypothetical protein